MLTGRVKRAHPAGERPRLTVSTMKHRYPNCSACRTALIRECTHAYCLIENALQIVNAT